MFSELNTPQWLFLAGLILSVSSIFALAIRGIILEIRYSGPYALASTSGKERWRRSTILALFQTGMLPIMILFLLTLSPYLEEGLVLPLFCSGVWVIAFPIAILYHRWDFERKIKRYQKIDKTLKREGGSDRYKTSHLPKFIQMFITEELQRFMSEGYPEESEDNGHVSVQKEN